MRNPFFLACMYFSEWLIVYRYAKAVYEKRNKYSAYITLFFYALLMISYIAIPTIEVLNVLFTLVCNFLCLYIAFKSTLKSSFFHSLILAITQCFTEAVTIYAVSFLSDSSNTEYYENDIIYMIDVIISKTLYFAISRLLLNFSNKENSTKSWGRWAALSILPISNIFILFIVRIFTNGQSFSLMESVLSILAIILLLIANVVVYFIYEKAESDNQKLIELELINQKNENDMQYLKMLEQKNMQMSIIAHDFRHHLSAIAEMSDSDEINQYINDMDEKITTYSQIAKTKNAFLDVILNKYMDICAEKSIKFEIEAFTDNLKFMSNFDLSSLFNNILDNAVEAAAQSREKYIHLEIARSIGMYHKIVVVNSSDNAPHSKGDVLLTTKSDKRAHGFGTKSVLTTIEKYGGEMLWEYNDKEREFKLTIAIPNENLISN